MLALLPAAAAAGPVGGRVYLSHQAAWADSMGRAESLHQLQAGVGDAVISVEPVPAAVQKKLLRGLSAVHAGPRIDQVHMQFVPRILVVTAGDSVQFTNLDEQYHNIFSVSSARHFDLGRMPPGTIETVRFDRSGVINLHCELHPEMIGYVVVVPNRIVARPDSLGAFVLPDLPRGRYVVHVWHPRGGEVAHAFEVPRHGGTRLALIF
ncbi:MAG: cupredoxin domain-containing protein [Candidatus Eiseniibacteriota bacterium]